jgi:DNA-binding SARP family transcriptional activator
MISSPVCVWSLAERGEPGQSYFARLEAVWPVLGEILESPPIRVYLAGRVAIERAGTLIESSRFPGQQGRVALAYLTLERGRPATRAELAEVLWRDRLPAAWESALSAIVSKLRSVIAGSALDGLVELQGARGCYELRLPSGAWVDLEAAADAIHEAESAFKAGDPRSAYGPSAVAQHIARRPFLPGEQGPWIEGWRDRLRGILLRALETRAEVYLWNGEHALALQSAKEIVTMEPFREAGHRLVMRAHAAMGNTAEALQAYEQCRKRIARELGVDPSPATKATYEALLQSL